MSLAAEPSREELDFFEKKIRPVLVEHCYKCHSSQAKSPKAGYLMDKGNGLLAGGDSGAAVLPGNVEESLLIDALRYGSLEMPPDGKLPDPVIADFERWVSRGAFMPEPQPAALASKPADAKPADAFWSFQPVKSPAPPTVQDENWPVTPVDRFVLAKLESHGLRPVPAADKRTLIRRVTFDLIGLPPTPDEMNAFLTDNSPDAYRTLVDRLLVSTHYGERWGRHWLDVVRYADTSGCNADIPVPSAYRYRNYVIESFNRDTPFDRFIQEQVAGDLLPSVTQKQHNEQVVATGYLAISQRFGSLADEFYLTLDDSIDNLGKGILGLSLSCARCHDHKYDPITMHDYYGLYGILASTRYAFPGTEIPRHPRDFVPLVPESERRQVIQPYLDELATIDQEIQRLFAKRQALDSGDEKTKVSEEWVAAQKRRDELMKQAPEYDKAYAVSEGTPANARLHKKGNPKDLAEEVSRGFLHVLGGQKLPDDEAGSGRLELAEWLSDPKNPLTPRVMVNRIWLHHFGRGIVPTPNDFGARGEPPTHPELLDYLARRFIDGGWSVKAMHRMIVLSRTYQMASRDNAENARIDPDNKLYWRFNGRRLDAEEIRDAMLAVSGMLDTSIGGPHPFKPAYEWHYTQHMPFRAEFPTHRRSVYMLQARIGRQPALEVFDGADPTVSVGQRPQSTTPPQALFMMNDPFVHEQADRFADRILSVDRGAAGRIERAFQLSLGRPPAAWETDDGQAYLAECVQKLNEAGVPAEQREHLAWASFLRILFSTNEFVYID